MHVQMKFEATGTLLSAGSVFDALGAASQDIIAFVPHGCKWSRALEAVPGGLAFVPLPHIDVHDF